MYVLCIQYTIHLHILYLCERSKFEENDLVIEFIVFRCKQWLNVAANRYEIREDQSSAMHQYAVVHTQILTKAM